jgi:porphobilinogen synthase
MDSSGNIAPFARRKAPAENSTAKTISPSTRLRRLRKSENLRRLVHESSVTLNDLIYPVFIEEEIDKPLPIATMPDVNRIPEKMLAEEMKAIASEGIRAVMLFGVSHKKNAIGSDALNKNGLIARMIKRAKDAAPDLVVISDTCFCEYTDHGHCGVLGDDGVDNDLTLANLAQQAVIAADAGVDLVAPSAMMDGQVAAIRAALDGAGHESVPIMSYSSKFASAFYGPFRAAAGCDLKGDRKTYQMDPMNGREALRESLIDEDEGADILMVKPALAYLDVLTKLRERTLLPLAAYQVSGEYAMIKFAAQAGALDEKRAVRETLGAIKRAGADIILTYFARDIAREGI